ncbi:MAG: LysM peptidoglycan-binding domain-containing protein, partial [Hyphomicrobiales bacterium]
MVNFRLPGRPLTAGARPIAGHLSRTLLLVATAAGLAVPLTFASAAESYVIQPGDTLSGIANRYGVDVAALALQNGIEDINLIRFGETLVIGGDDAAEPASAEAKTHVVQPGETLSSIAALYGMDLYDIAIANGLSDVDLVYAGQELVISSDPPTQRHENYTVEPGDSLAAIADKFNVLVRDLVDFNGIEDPDVIVAGQVLEIPTSQTEVPAYRVSREEAEAALKNAEIEYGLPPGLLQALAWQESGWQQHVISDAGAVGLTQLLPSTAEW